MTRAEMTWGDALDYSCVIDGRPDLERGRGCSFGVTFAKRFPPYVYSTTRMGALVHRVLEVELHWYVPDYHRLIRRVSPLVIVRTHCDQVSFPKGRGTRKPSNASTCVVPSPDALMCGRCHGRPATFGWDGEATKLGITRKEANARLGCLTEVER